MQVLDAWTIVMFSKWISQHFLCCADAEYAAQPSKEERNSWKVAMDLDHVPWKALCKMYGLNRSAPDECRRTARRALRCVVAEGSNKVRCSCLSL